MSNWMWIVAVFVLLFVVARATGLLGGGDTEEASALIEQGEALVLDVRTAGEHRAGHLQGDHNIPVQDLAARTDEVLRLAGSKDKPVVVYCASGNRSSAAQRILAAKGFTHVTNGGGFSRLAAKLPALVRR
jgi:phage shock protein E